MYRRPMFQTLPARVRERRRFLRVLAGPPQSGKTTLVHQVLKTIKLPSHYASADASSLQSGIWTEQQWEVARLLVREARGRDGAVLVLDEIQKVPGWSEIVKRCWDADTAARLPPQGRPPRLRPCASRILIIRIRVDFSRDLHQAARHG